MATQTDIQRIFQLLHIPVSEKERHIENTGRYLAMSLVKVLKVLTMLLFFIVVRTYIKWTVLSYFL
jgi:hypothetical protein